MSKSGKNIKHTQKSPHRDRESWSIQLQVQEINTGYHPTSLEVHPDIVSEKLPRGSGHCFFEILSTHRILSNYYKQNHT